jgi:uncharacterized protein (TIGR04255 family)
MPDAGTYRKTFLKEVIARVDFLSPLPGIDAALPPALSEAAIRSFPIPEPRQAVQHQVEIGPHPVRSSSESIKEWLFHGKDRTKTLTIGRQVLVLQQKSYQSYESLRDEFVGVLAQVSELFKGIQTSRIGLRYINAIQLPEPNPTDWSAYITPSLLSLFDFPTAEERRALSRVLHHIEVAFDTFNLRYVAGVHNPDYPAPIRQKTFVLDLDAFAQSAVELRDVGPLLDRFHESIQRYFERSITQALRDKMNE